MTEANGSPQPGFASIDTRLTWDTSIAYQPPSPSSVEPAPDFGRKPSNKRALNETRKLLSHVLAQLENRKTPASVVDTLMQATDAGSRGISAVAEKLKEVVKVANRSNSRAPVNNTDRQDESDEEDDGSEFTTDETYDLLLQLKDVLVIATAQGWAIFDDGLVPCHLSEISSHYSLLARHFQWPRMREARDSHLRSDAHGVFLKAAPISLLPLRQLVAK